MSQVYVEVMVHPSQMWTCTDCHKLITWPEEARVYAINTTAPPSLFQHATHPAKKGAIPLSTGGLRTVSRWSVLHVAPDGTTDVVDTFTTEAEALDAAEYANQTRDAAQSIDGTLFEVRPVN